MWKKLPAEHAEICASLHFTNIVTSLLSVVTKTEGNNLIRDTTYFVLFTLLVLQLTKQFLTPKEKDLSLFEVCKNPRTEMSFNFK